jgi:hypothetical protein
LAPLHRGQIRVGAHVVGGQQQVRDPRDGVRPVLPGAHGVHEQRLGVRSAAGVRELDCGVEEPAQDVALVEHRLGPVVEVVGELAPDLVVDLLPAAARGDLARAPARRLPVRDVDRENAPHPPVAVAGEVHAAQNCACEIDVSAHSESI